MQWTTDSGTEEPCFDVNALEFNAIISIVFFIFSLYYTFKIFGALFDSHSLVPEPSIPPSEERQNQHHSHGCGFSLATWRVGRTEPNPFRGSSEPLSGECPSSQALSRASPTRSCL